MKTQLYYHSKSPSASIDHGRTSGAIVNLKDNPKLANRIVAFVQKNGQSDDAQLHRDHWAIFVDDPPAWVEEALYPKGWMTEGQMLNGIGKNEYADELAGFVRPS